MFGKGHTRKLWFWLTTERSVSIYMTVEQYESGLKFLRKSKRQAILDSALLILGEGGLEGFSASSVATQAGVSKANLYHHFKSLDDILHEAFEQFALGMAMQDLPKDISFRDWLLGLGAAVLGNNAGEIVLGQAYFVFASRAFFDEALRARMGLTVTKASDGFCKIVMQLTKEDLPPDEARALGDLIFMTADGMGIHNLVFPDRREAIGAAWGVFVDRIVPPAH